MMDKLRRSINSTFKLNGFSLSSDATSYLLGILGPMPDNQSLWLDRIIDKVQKQTLLSTLITRDVVEIAVKECGKGEQHDHTDILSFIAAYNFPKVIYDPEKKKFIPNNDAKSILPAASEKPQIYQDRYTLLHQRTLHHELFTPKIAGVESDSGKQKFSLHAIEFLVGCTSRLENIVVLGMITQLKEGKFYLEDPTGSVQIDLSVTKFQSGMFTENCFVLAEGFYDDGIFNVTAIGLPPPEEASVTRTYYGNTNFFGSPSTVQRGRLLQLEAENEGAPFVFLSEVHLDNINVMQKLRVLFQGYEDAPPIAFVFLGNFLSEPHGGQSCLVLRDSFKALADLILEFPNLIENSKFVIIPGPGDPGFVNILPRPPFPEVMTEYVRENIPSVIFMSNPCRIKYCTKEIVVFREDVMAKMCRNSLYFQTTENVPSHFVKTLIGQCHLCPLPLHVCPIYWSYDHALHLYPLPDLVVIGDKCDPFVEQQLGAIFTNPGSFVKTDFSFKIYLPYENKIDECQLPPEET